MELTAHRYTLINNPPDNTSFTILPLDATLVIGIDVSAQSGYREHVQHSFAIDTNLSIAILQTTSTGAGLDPGGGINLQGGIVNVPTIFHLQGSSTESGASISPFPKLPFVNLSTETTRIVLDNGRVVYGQMIGTGVSISLLPIDTYFQASETIILFHFDGKTLIVDLTRGVGRALYYGLGLNNSSSSGLHASEFWGCQE